MSFRPFKRVEGRSAPTSPSSVDTVEAAETSAGGRVNVAEYGKSRGPWLLNCLYTAQKMKKKKSWKDGYCVCHRMTGFLRITLFGADNCGDIAPLFKTPSNAHALDTTELPLTPVEQLLEEEIELPLHLVLVQGFAVHDEESNTGEQRRFPEINFAPQWSAKVRPQPPQHRGPPEQHNMRLRRHCASHACEARPVMSCTEAPSGAQEISGRPLVALPRARAPRAVPADSSMLIASEFVSRISREAGVPPVTHDDKRSLPVRPQPRSSDLEVSQCYSTPRKCRERQNDCSLGETDGTQPSRGTNVPAGHRAGEMHMTPHSLMKKLGKEVWSIMADTQSRQAAPTQVMLRTSHSLCWRQQFTGPTSSSYKPCTIPDESTLGETTEEPPICQTSTGFGEQMMFSRLFDLSAK